MNLLSLSSVQIFHSPINEGSSISSAWPINVKIRLIFYSQNVVQRDWISEMNHYLYELALHVSWIHRCWQTLCHNIGKQCGPYPPVTHSLSIILWYKSILGQFSHLIDFLYSVCLLFENQERKTACHRLKFTKSLRSSYELGQHHINKEFIETYVR